MVAVAALYLTLLLGQDANLSKVVVSPTGQNGYEEYVQAATVLSLRQNRALEAYVRAREREATDFTETPRPAMIPADASLLQVYRIELKTLAPALQWIRKGNEKPVVYPAPKISAITLFPELSYWKVAARLFARSAYVAFADGDPAGATRSILEGLAFSKKIAVGGEIHFLVSGACEQILFAAVQEHLLSFSLHDAELLQAWAEDSAKSPSALIQAAEVERKSFHQSVVDIFGSPSDLLEVMDIKEEDKAEFTRKLSAITDARKEVLYRRFFQRLESPWVAIKARLGEPEATWLDPIEVESAGDDEPLKADLDATELGATFGTLRLLSMLGLGDEETLSIVPIAARFRIQERLLRLYAGVLRFKWENGRLPSSLAEVFGQEPTDPASGQAYVFEPNEHGRFRILCSTKRLGEVDLVYKSASAGEDQGPVPP